MPYIPKSKILNNLYTTGGEYVIKTTQENYIGFYHRYYNGTVFSGRNPDEQYIQELEVPQKAVNLTNNTQITNTLFSEDPDPEVDKTQYNPNMNYLYTFLKTGTVNQVRTQKIPQPYFYTPTDQDYTLGEIRRYFAKKSNEIRYVEIDQKTYSSILNQDSNYAWQYYLVFDLPWLITGDKIKVATVNKNMIDLTQQTLKIQGLPEFLKYDYLKFYK